MALCCPITSKINDYPFEVRIIIKNKIDGVILSDQIKSLDWKKRRARYIASASKEKLNETVEKLSLLIKS